jgi:hypothetical protein
MKRYIRSFWIVLLTVWCTAFFSSSAQDTQRQRNSNRNRTDTASDSRMRKSNIPPVQKQDSLPVPLPGKPLQDTLLKRY